MVPKSGVEPTQINHSGSLISQPAGTFSLIGGLRIAGFPPLPGFFAKVYLRRVGLVVGKSLGVLFTLVIASVVFLNLYLGVILTIYLGGRRN